MRWRDFDTLTPLSASFFSTPRRVHFIGIGGIGMSALAFALKSRGHEVSGSDANDSPMLERLQQAGVITTVGHSAGNLHLLGQQAEAVIWGSAISADNPENATAVAAGLPIWHRAQMLAYFANSAKRSIAVSGTHGKSSTSAMIAHILAKLGHNPTALLGAEYPPFGSNARIGDPDLVVVEADESDGSFTLLHPTITVVLNVEPEHLENYDNSEDELWRAFDQFAEQAGEHVVYNADDTNLKQRWSSRDNAAGYGLKESDSQLRAASVRIETGAMSFELESAGHTIGHATLGAPGNHNVSNSLAAILAVTKLGIDTAEAAGTLGDFHGVKRRFERAGQADNIVVYNDYGHHPTEVARTLETARDFLQRPVVAVFQPHRYSRTQQIGRDFGTAFKAADRIIITELYSAFEEPIAGVSGRIVFDAVKENETDKDVRFAASLEEARALALELAQPGDALFCLGAGDIGGLPAKLVDDLQQREVPGPVTQPVKLNEPLARHCTMRVGGPAHQWLEPQNEQELAQQLKHIQSEGTPLYIFGAGSNLIPHDAGFDGAIIKLGGDFGRYRIDREVLIAGGAMLLPKLTHIALDNCLGNFEWACGVPGTVGGSVWGNAGARGFNGKAFESRDCATDLQCVVAFDRSGKRHVIQRSEIEFGYRKSSLGELIVTEASFKLKPLSKDQAQFHREQVKELLRIRRETQPASAASAGCIWKNPNSDTFTSAGQVIESLNLQGERSGGAQISELHANFIVNTGGATGADVRALATHIEEIVQQKTGITLEREARFLDA